MTPELRQAVVDPNEAPEGYYAVPKPCWHKVHANLCTFCDWRPECQKEETDFTNHNHRCMSYAVITPNGTEVKRNDGCSVVFKKKPKQQASLF